MPFSETGKDRAAHIPYSYTRESDRLIRLRLGVTGAILLVCAACVSWGYFSAAGRTTVNPGPLQRVHATWDTKCNTCHVDVPWSAIGRSAAYGIASDAGDAKCRVCHMGDKAREGHHFATENKHMRPHCAQCHSDHGGREMSLIRRDDGQCTSCHAKLGDALAGAPRMKTIERRITGFHNGSHPEFNSVAKDPGHLKFNHALHMAPGLKKAQDGQDFTYGDVAESERERRGWDAKLSPEPVQLDCTSCHRLDGGDSSLKPDSDLGRPPRVPGLPGTLLAERSSGAYMVPIIYEQHCAACHPLNVVGPVAVQHRLQPADLEESLRAGYVSLGLRQKQADLDKIEPTGRTGPRANAKAFRQEVDRKVDTATRFLFSEGKNTCTECHEYIEQNGGRFVAGGKINTARFSVAPAAIPSVWFGHALFDHSAHRSVDCKSCHARAYAGDEPSPPVEPGECAKSPYPSTCKDDVLIPQKETCLKCHRPPATEGGMSVGGAGYACVECHTYHNGERPRQGRGAAARGPVSRSDISKFLLGTPDPSASAP